MPAGSLAGALAALLGDADRARRLGQAARATAEERFASGRVADAWLDAYATVLSSA